MEPFMNLTFSQETLSLSRLRQTTEALEKQKIKLK